jgi:hypothetical protein
MSTQEPAVAELVIAFNELDTITFRQGQFVGSTSSKVVNDEQDSARQGVTSASSRSHCDRGGVCRREGVVVDDDDDDDDDEVNVANRRRGRQREAVNYNVDRNGGFTGSRAQRCVSENDSGDGLSGARGNVDSLYSNGSMLYLSSKAGFINGSGGCGRWAGRAERLVVSVDGNPRIAIAVALKLFLFSKAAPTNNIRKRP